MNDELKNVLFKKFPSLYEEKEGLGLFQALEFHSQTGWFCLIETVSEVMVKRSLMIKVIRVYKQQGRLKFDVSNCPHKDRDFIAGVIKMAHVVSGICCEECSLQGEMFNGNAISSRCVKHGGVRLHFLKRRKNVDLPFNTRDIEKMWREMIIKLFLQFQMMKIDKESSEPVLTRVETKAGKLNIKYTGGNDMTNGMVTLFLSYAEKIDAETGKIIKKH